MQRILLKLIPVLIFVLQISSSQNGWTVRSSGLRNIYCVKAVDQNVAWAAGDSGTVGLTTDGGSTWTPVGSGTIGTAIVWNIDAISANIAFVTTTPLSTTYIYRTTNGGASWSVVYSQVGGFTNDIHMIDGANGIAYGDPVGGKWTVLRTTDGGSTWGRLPNEPTPAAGEFGFYYNSLSVVGSSHIWFGTTSDRIYRSTDGGATWSFGSAPTSNSLNVWFNTVDLGLSSSNGTGARSTDSGLTWSAITYPPGNARALSGAGSSDFWCTTQSGGYRSTDRGTSWTLELPPNNYGALDFVTLGNSAVGYAANVSGGFARFVGTITSVDETNNITPSHFVLHQNYPNPFNPTTTIKFHLPSSSFVTLKVFNLLGEEVAAIVNQDLMPGTYERVFDGGGLASGVYLYRLQARGFTQTRNLVLIK